MIHARQIFVPLFLFAASLASTAATHTHGVTKDIPYTVDSTGIYHGDLYRPADSPDPAPAIVMIHGGSWRSGHKREMAHLAADLAAHGYVCFSIDYDVRPHSFPTSWQESRAAVDFLRAHAGDYHLDAGRIAVLGSSAGGELAALVALEPTGPASDTVQREVPVQAAVTLNGGYDAHTQTHSPLHTMVIKRYLGGKCERVADVCDDASPATHVGNADVPFFIGHGSHDHLIPFTQATDFTGLLREEQNPVTLFVADGGGHNYWHKKKFYAQNLAAVEAFLDNVLRKA